MCPAKLNPDALAALADELDGRGLLGLSMRVAYFRPPDLKVPDAAGRLRPAGDDDELDAPLNFANDILGVIRGAVLDMPLEEHLTLHEDAYENWYAVGIDVPGTDPPVIVLTQPLALESVWTRTATAETLAWAGDHFASLINEAEPFVIAAATSRLSD